MRLDPDQLRAFARRYTGAWCSHDPEKVAAHYTPGGSLAINGGEPARGRAAVTEVARSFMTAFPDMRCCGPWPAGAAQFLRSERAFWEEQPGVVVADVFTRVDAGRAALPRGRARRY